MENTKLTSAIVFLTAQRDGRRLMLEPVVFVKPAQWLSLSLSQAGVERFLVVCREEDVSEAEELFPRNTCFITDADPAARDELKNFLRDTEGRVAVFTKPVLFFRQGAEQLAGEGPLSRGKSAAGAFRASAERLLAALRETEDLQSVLERIGENADSCVTALSGDFVSRAAAQETGRRLTAAWWMERGVDLLDYDSTYIAPTVTLEPGTTLLPGTILRGATHIGKNCEIGPNTQLADVTVGEGTTVNASQGFRCTIGAGAVIGPYAYLRPDTVVEDSVKIGDFVELKNCTIGAGTKIGHMAYIGDADVGPGVNIGAGTATVNYDGTKKYRTRIGAGAFIGCNTNLVAPVNVGDGAYIAAGSTITRDVPRESLAIARSQQTVKHQWVKKKRKA